MNINMNNPHTSPHKLEIKTNIKTTTINKKIKLLVFLIISVSFSLIVYGIISKSNKEKLQLTNQSSSNHKLEAATDFAKIIYKDVPNGSYRQQQPLEKEINQSQVDHSNISSSPNPNANNSNQVDQLKAELSKQLAQTRFQDALKARSAKVSSDGFGGGVNADTANVSSSDNNATINHLPSSYNNHRAGDSYKDLAQMQNMMSDQNKQIRKEKFLKEAGNNDDSYLPSLLSTPISPYEVKAGGVIPAIMISGINSNLPGQIMAQVRENIYDSVTGDYLLIPQGAKLIGNYDSQVAYGQERVLVVWNRLIMPNGSSLDLKGMTGSDLKGYAGFADLVDHHYFRTFSSAIMMSVISTGTQVTSSKQATTNENERSVKDTAISNIGNQMAQTSAAIMNKNLNVQPEIKIRPGYLFNVMINRDLILPSPYIAH